MPHANTVTSDISLTIDHFISLLNNITFVISLIIKIKPSNYHLTTTNFSLIRIIFIYGFLITSFILLIFSVFI